MLRYRGHASEIRFGVRPPEAGSTALQAHAWIEHAGLVVLGEIGQSDYRVMTRTSISERP
jgi:hypothetical protein